MHILILPSNYPNSYFPEKTCFFRDYVRIASQQGHQVGVVALIAVSIKDIIKQRRIDLGLRQSQEGTIVTRLYLYPTPPKCRILDRAIRYRLTRRTVRQYVQQHGMPDLIHAHGLPAGEEARWWHQLTGVPYLFTAHATIFYGPGNDKHLRTLDRVVSSAARCTAVSQGFAEHLATQSKSPFSFLPNPVDTEFFQPAPFKRVDNRPWTFVNVADLKARKNHETLIRAFGQAFGSTTTHQLLIGGEGAERHRLERLISDLGLQNCIRLLGHLDRHQVLDLLQNGDCFVLTSIHETFGVVLIEAMACGLPVIATRSHGPESVITSPGLGDLVPNDVQALARALSRAPNRKTDPRFLRDHVVTTYSFEAIGSRLDTIYSDLTKKPL